MANYNTNMSSLKTTQGHYEEALDFSLKSIDLYTEMEDKVGIAVGYGNVGTIHYHLGNYELSMENRLSFVENAIQKDIKFRNSLKGMVIGQYTLEEYELYIANSSALNKRMMNMVIERLKDQIQLFTAPALV